MKEQLVCFKNCKEGNHCFCRKIMRTHGLYEYVTNDGEIYDVCCRCSFEKIKDSEDGGRKSA